MDIYVTSGKWLLKTFFSNQIFFLKTKDFFFKTGSTTTEDGKVKGGQLYVIKNTGARGLPGRGFSAKVKNPFLWKQRQIFPAKNPRKCEDWSLLWSILT